MEDAVEPFWDKIFATAKHRAIFPIALNDMSVSRNPDSICSAHVDRFIDTSEWLTVVKRFVNIKKVIMVGPGGKIVGFNENNGFKPSQLVSFFDFVK